MKKLIASLVAIMILVCGCTAAFAEQKALTGEEALQAALEQVGLNEKEVEQKQGRHGGRNAAGAVRGDDRDQQDAQAHADGPLPPALEAAAPEGADADGSDRTNG